MLESQRQQLASFLHDAVHALAREQSKALPDIDLATVASALEKPRQSEHGDIATNIALRLAKPLGMPPPKIGQEIAAALRASPALAALVESIEVAGPGFINFRLAHVARAQVLALIAANPQTFGMQPIAADAPHVLIEFVSANPTGPLHVGHGRQAALGDTLAAMLSASGLRVSREFYYNDAGAQINNLAISVQARAKGISTDDPAFPADGYRGDYISDIAQAYLNKETVRAFDGEPITSNGDVEDLEEIRRFAVTYLRHEQDLDLRAFGVAFDRYYLESSLYSDGRVGATVDALVKSGHTYEHEGALWLRSTDFGDDKDRVMRKSDGSYTYFVPDVAYHVTKWERGFSKAINIQGSDHHGTIARVRAGLQALNIGIPKGFPDYVLHKMVTVMRGGQEVKISKRAGSYVTLRDLITWSGEIEDPTDKIIAVDEQRGRDAVRFFLVSRKADSEFTFDVDLALSRSEDNPVYYVQYAHARCCSVLAQANVDAAQILGQAAAASLLGQLSAPKEQALLNRLSAFPEVIQDCAKELSPHLMAFYLRDLAADFHGFYNSERVLVDDAVLKSARLLLVAATSQVLRLGLGLLGVSAPVRM
ncbi:MAG: arginine--tRNA ligase [Burkholderiaceae bacterium]|nr:arginine--tRNA ligase [Burkholderiaceae bacterium]